MEKVNKGFESISLWNIFKNFFILTVFFLFFFFIFPIKINSVKTFLKWYLTNAIGHLLTKPYNY